MPQIEALPEGNPLVASAEFSERGRKLALDGHPREALELFAKALTLDPKNVPALVCSGAAAAECKFWDDARKYTLAALDLPLNDNDAAIALNNLGMTYYARRQYDEAIDCFNQAMVRDRFYKQPIVSKGAVLVAMNRLAEAYELFTRANLLNPHDWEPIVNRGILHMLRGDWDLGLPGYEHRKLEGEAADIKWPVPKWTGEKLNGRGVLIWPDQGLGDCIWAHRLVAEVARQGKVYLQIYEPLREIMPIPDGVTFVKPGDQIECLHFQVPVMSLPYCLRLRHDTAPPPYGLTVKRTPIEHGPLRIGLCWAGNIHHKLDDLRSTRLEQWRQLRATLPDAQLFNLQYQIKPTDEAALAAMEFENEPIKPFLKLAELVATLDLVISADTVFLHVAAEMGVPTWGLIPLASDFRWGQHGNTVAWYPSLKLYRNRHNKDGWDDVIERVCADLKEWQK